MFLGGAKFPETETEKFNKLASLETEMPGNNDNKNLYTQGPSLLCMNDVLGQLGEIGEIEQEGSDHKVANIIFIFVIIITRPKQTGSCGQDSNQAGTFRGVLNVSLCVLGALLGLYIVAQIQFF